MRVPLHFVLLALILCASTGCTPGMPIGGHRLAVVSPPDGSVIPAGARFALDVRVEGSEPVPPVEITMQGKPAGSLVPGPAPHALLAAGPRAGDAGVYVMNAGGARASVAITVGPPGVPRAFRIEAFSPSFDGPGGAASAGPLAVLFSEAPQGASVVAHAAPAPRPGEPTPAAQRLEAEPTSVPELWLLWPRAPFAQGRAQRVLIGARRAVDGALLPRFETEIPVAAASPGRVAGWVLDARLQPLQGALVNAGTAIAATNPRGFFALEGVGPGPVRLLVRPSLGTVPQEFAILAPGTLPHPLVMGSAGMKTDAAAPPFLLHDPDGTPVVGAAALIGGVWAYSVATLPPGAPGSPGRPFSEPAFIAGADGQLQVINAEFAVTEGGGLEGRLVRVPQARATPHVFPRAAAPQIAWPTPGKPSRELIGAAEHAARRLASAGWLTEAELTDHSRGSVGSALCRALVRLQCLLFLDGNGDRADGVLHLPPGQLEPLGTLGTTTLQRLVHALPPPAWRRLGDPPPLPGLGLSRSVPLPPSPAILTALAMSPEVAAIEVPPAAAPPNPRANPAPGRLRAAPLPDGVARIHLATSVAAPRETATESAAARFNQLVQAAATLRAPEVDAQEPAHGAALVDCDLVPWMRFREPVDPMRVSVNTVELVALTPAPRTVPAALCVLPDNRTLVVRPAGALDPWTSYRLTVSREALGQPHSKGVLVTFNTGPAHAEPSLTPTPARDTGTPAAPAVGAVWWLSERWRSVRLATHAIRWFPAPEPR